MERLHHRVLFGICLILNFCSTLGSDINDSDHRTPRIKSEKIYDNYIDHKIKRIKVEPRWGSDDQRSHDTQQIIDALILLSNAPIVFPINENNTVPPLNLVPIKIEPQDDDTCHAPALYKVPRVKPWFVVINSLYYRQNTVIATALNRQAYAKNTAGQFREALVDYDQALALTLINNKVKALLLYNRGITKAKIGYIDEAIADLKKSLKFKYALTPEQELNIHNKLNLLHLRSDWLKSNAGII